MDQNDIKNRIDECIKFINGCTHLNKKYWCEKLDEAQKLHDSTNTCYERTNKNEKCRLVD